MSLKEFDRIRTDCPWYTTETRYKKASYCKPTGYICCKNNCAIFYMITARINKKQGVVLC